MLILGHYVFYHNFTKLLPHLIFFPPSSGRKIGLPLPLTIPFYQFTCFAQGSAMSLELLYALSSVEWKHSQCSLVTSTNKLKRKVLHSQTCELIAKVSVHEMSNYARDIDQISYEKSNRSNLCFV